MRRILEVLERTRHPVTIITKGALILRDLDILSAMAKDGLVHVAISVTTLDPVMARTMEPRAPTPARRLEAIARLAEAGVPTGVMVAPVIPSINEAEIEAIMERARAAGARYADYVMLRLPLETGEVFGQWLLTHFPDRYQRVMNLIRSTRGGTLYDATFGRRMRGTGPLAALVAQRFSLAHKRLSFDEKPPVLRTDLFVPPVPKGGQFSLFEKV
jgi:DNA repair photolyase